MKTVTCRIYESSNQQLKEINAIRVLSGKSFLSTADLLEKLIIKEREKQNK